ncbi:SDR family NAD(P)-dependent oxidoreductase [Nonomuraea candida]|uniref:SDR family NAD(P)-dependent oxidoreductase n=1 Tax=Nonomuraea candida TaxID=359159 RepID=UPI0005BE01FF|nr:SDR family NAD(P)-dependent oxidoreductase [Nonomuraea candida]
MTPPTIVMTGATSGLGAIAAARMTAAGARLLVGARGPGPHTGDGLPPLDLSRLDSVRAFAAALEEHLGATPIDVLALNAGVSFHHIDQRTADGYETTFAVNHLAHYLLLRRLLPRLADGGRVVITSSSVHDPERGGTLPPPRHASAKLLAAPELDPDRESSPRAAGGHAYTASKLCGLMTARTLARRPETLDKRLTVLAYDPGPTPGTGLSRNFSLPIRIVWSLLGTPLGALVPRMNSRRAAGHTLADLCLGTITPPAGQGYASLVRGRLTWPQPSKTARDDAAGEALWQDSAALVGLPA